MTEKLLETRNEAKVIPHLSHGLILSKTEIINRWKERVYKAMPATLKGPERSEENSIIPLGEGIVGEVAQTSRPLIVNKKKWEYYTDSQGSDRCPLSRKIRSPYFS